MGRPTAKAGDKKAAAAAGDDGPDVAEQLAALQEQHEALREKYGSAVAALQESEAVRDELVHDLRSASVQLQTTSAKLSAETDAALHGNGAAAAAGAGTGTGTTTAGRGGGSNSRMEALKSMEDALGDMLLELRQRDEDGSVPFDYVKQRAALMRQCNNDPLVMLDMLRSSLRLQLAAQDEVQQGLQFAMENLDVATNDTAAKQYNHINSLAEQLVGMEQERDDALQQLAAAQAANSRGLQAANKAMEQVSAENKELQKALETSQKQVNMYVEELRSHRFADMKRELESRIMQLEEDVRVAQHEHRVHVQKLETRHSKQLEGLHYQLSRTSRLAAQKQALEEKVEVLQASISDYKRNTKLMEYEKALTQAKRACDMSSRYQKDLEATQLRLKRCQAALRERDKKIDAMKTEYNKLFRAVQAAQADKKPKHLSPQEAHEAASKNPHYANFYKKKLQERDQQIKHLKDRIHNLMSQGIHQKGHIRNFQAERSRSAAELGRVRNEMRQLNSKLALTKEDLQETKKELELTVEEKQAILARKNHWINSLDEAGGSSAADASDSGSASIASPASHSHGTRSPSPSRSQSGSPVAAALRSARAASSGTATHAKTQVSVTVSSTTSLQVFKPVTVGALSTRSRTASGASDGSMPASPQYSGVPRSDVRMLKDLLDLDKLEQDTKAVPSSARGSGSRGARARMKKRPTSAHTPSSHQRRTLTSSASGPALRVSHDSLLRGRTTYQPPAQRSRSTHRLRPSSVPLPKRAEKRQTYQQHRKQPPPPGSSVVVGSLLRPASARVSGALRQLNK